MHYYSCNRTIDAPDFNEWWKIQEPCERDGAGYGQIQSISSYLNNPKLSCNDKVNKRAYAKALAKRLIPGKYQTLVIDCGISGWCCERKVTRVIDHHRKEVTERRYYKTRPKTALKGGRIRAIHSYIYSYDAREYDPLEHC